MNLPRSTALAALGLLFATLPVRAQTPPPGERPAPPAAAKSPPATPARPAKDAGKAPPANRPATTNATAPTPPPAPNAGVQQMVSEFDTQRQARLDQRKVLLERLQLAKNDEEKQRILAELRVQQQQRLDQQREVARQIREQLQNQRGELRPATPGS